MIGLLTKVKIIDNSGGIEGKCIKILSPSHNKTGKREYWGKVGDLILITLTKVIPGSKIKKGSLYKALIVRSKKYSNKKVKSIDYINNNKINVSSYLKNNNNWNSSLIKINKYNNVNNINKLYSISNNRHTLNLDTINNIFFDNSVVLVKLNNKNDNDYTPLGTRIKGPLCKSLKLRKGCSKIMSITTKFI